MLSNINTAIAERGCPGRYPVRAMETRADRIYKILIENDGRMKVADLHQRIAAVEEVDPANLNTSTVPSTTRQDNTTKRNQGRQTRFNVHNDGSESHGYISAINPATQTTDPIPDLIETENDKVRDQLKAAVKQMSWQEFESSFLEEILDALGFTEISLTQRTRDGGKDALCSYKRGLVNSEAIVSAKRWNSQSVAADEVQRLRGIKGNADTAIVVTTSTFTADAVKESEPSQNQRSIVLVDGDLIVDTCLEHGIGVRRRELPATYVFEGFEREIEGNAE